MGELDRLANRVGRTRTRLRNRAVRLTEDALTQLSAAVYERWNQEGKTDKLTRAERARLLGNCSAVTADRILTRNGVDKSTLILACKSVGLRWEDSMCEPVAEESDLIQPEMSTDADGALPSEPPRTKNRKFSPYAAAFVLVAMLLVLIIPGPIRQEVSNRIRSHQKHIASEDFNANFFPAAQMYEDGKYVEAAKRCTIAIARARELENSELLAMSIGLSAQIASAQGRLSDALDSYRQVLDLHKLRGATKSFAPMLELIGDLETQLGQYEDAERSLLQSLEGYRREKEPGGIAMALRDLGTLKYETDHLDQAMDYLDRALIQLNGLSDLAMVHDIKARRALVLAEKGMSADARSDLKSALRFWEIRAHDRWIANTLSKLGQVELIDGNVELARSHITKAREHYSRVQDKAGEQKCDRELAKIASRPETDQSLILSD